MSNAEIRKNSQARFQIWRLYVFSGVPGSAGILAGEATYQHSSPARMPALPGTAKCRTTYIPLNVHSYYSFLDSTLSINAIIDLAGRHELPALALTDKNNLHGAVEFAQAAAQAGIKPIIGAEIQWRGQRVCLYVENQIGYRNLCRILNRVAGSGLSKDSSSAGALPLT